MDDETEEIYELTAQILVLGYSAEDAKERAERQILINDMFETPVKSTWTHIKNPKYRQATIDRLTWKIKGKER